ncbi:MAG: hypothetical protein HY063_14150 [Bacteroidetes bacterium]|nr:hypothetical protein [Bacteroidota bacterium]
MQSRFKPKFWKDINRVKNDREIMSALYKIFTNVENAESADEINNIKELEKFDARYRIKLSLDKKRDYRIGLYVHGKTVWFARFLHRNKIYDENW